MTQDAADTPQAQRAARLAAALRANLHRRKSQQRARDAVADDAMEAPAQDHATAPPRRDNDR